MTEPGMPTVAHVEQYGAYHLITYGSWQVTVDNVGMIKLPALCSPAMVDDLIGALVAAQPVAIKQQEDNADAQKQMNEFFAAQRAASQEKEEAVRGARQVAVPRTAQPKTPPERARRSKAGGPRGARNTPAAKKAAAKKAAPPRKAPVPPPEPEPVRRPRAAQKRNG